MRRIGSPAGDEAREQRRTSLALSSFTDNDLNEPLALPCSDVTCARIAESPTWKAERVGPRGVSECDRSARACSAGRSPRRRGFRIGGGRQQRHRSSRHHQTTQRDCASRNGTHVALLLRRLSANYCPFRGELTRFSAGLQSPGSETSGRGVALGKRRVKRSNRSLNCARPDRSPSTLSFGKFGATPTAGS